MGSSSDNIVRSLRLASFFNRIKSVTIKHLRFERLIGRHVLLSHTKLFQILVYQIFISGY